jgi:hypothetical protein
MVAIVVGRNDFALRYLDRALALQADYAPAQEARARVAAMPSPPPAPTPSYLLIKSWGTGFWSDVDHVLGQLLLCQITGRIPVIHWGANCLFGGSERQSSFDRYFLPVSKFTIHDLLNQPGSFYPPKWNAANLLSEDINKAQGPYSRMAALYFLARPESVAVADFYTGVVCVRDWIPPSHPLAGKTVGELYRHLIQTYLKPQPVIVDEVDAFYQRHLDGHPTIAVHLRGSDKALEVTNLPEVNSSIENAIASEIKRDPRTLIFLLTDDENILRKYQQLHGPRLITTAAHRTSTEKGVHYLPISDRYQLGKDVMIDTYLATRCHRFVGSGTSNLSAIMPYLKPWPVGTCVLAASGFLHRPNKFIHNW